MGMRQTGPRSGARRTPRRAPARAPLDRARVLRAAIALADAEGLGALSMRRLGDALGVEAMSLYNHVAGKDDLLNGIVDLVGGEFGVPDAGSAWQEALRTRARAARRVLLLHPWAPGLIEARVDFGSARLPIFEALIGILRGAGFSIEATYDALILLDSFIYGFVLQEVSWIASAREAAGGPQPDFPAGALPNIREMWAFVRGRTPPGSNGRASSYEHEFEVGLGLVLGSLERLLARGGEAETAG
ncbi:MAG: TetR/AcrR family transcriptional regulator C-terminal domain-containing protein [Anaeromyxobacteraceae bacterium]